MLLPEDGLEALVAQLGAMPGRDRRAILSRLSASDRARLSAWTRQPADPASRLPYSPDIVARIVAVRASERGSEALTPAAAEALTRAADRGASARPTRSVPGMSLADSLGALLRSRRGLP